MLGMKLVRSKKGKEPNPEAVKEIIDLAVQKSLLLKSAGANANVIRFLSPLCVTDEQIKEGLAIMKQCIDQVAKKKAASS